MNTLFVGIDVSTKHNQVCTINSNHKVFFNISFDNTPDGSSMLLNAVLDTFKEENFDDIVCVAESTSVYDYHICSYLLSELSTIGINSSVYSVNAKLIRNYKKTYNEIEKTDPSDAFICADFARALDIKKLTPFKANQNIALQRMTRERVHLSQMLVREKNYTLNNVYLKVSGLATAVGKDKPFSDNFSAIAEAILTEFNDPYDLAELPLNDLVGYLQAASKNKGVDDYEKMAELIKKAINNSYRMDKVSYDCITSAITASINVIECLEKQIRILDKAIEREMKGLYSNEYAILQSIRGIGPVISAGILAEIGDISYFDDDGALAKYAGLYWKRNDSGDLVSEDKRNPKSCNTYLKYYMNLAAQCTVHFGFGFTSDFFWKKYSETKTHKQKRALVLTSRKLLRLIFVLLRDKKMYEPVSVQDSGK